ncbi:TonB-dependent receptor plug domain-containing protein, partial [Rhizobium leguminosarum]|uniref:TonB-dependent receptor plug domain-containing protein n=1 Tax=Rhizobium leguminosarum TaxID=384 RepID=UPI003F9532E8
IVIQGGGDTATSPVKGYFAKNSSAGSKSYTPLNEIPQSVSVIGTREMDDRGITNKIYEALLYTPGVTSQPFGNDGDTDWFY